MILLTEEGKPAASHTTASCNGGEAWRGRKDLAWDSMHKGRDLGHGTCFYKRCLKNEGGYGNYYEDDIKLQILYGNKEVDIFWFYTFSFYNCN